MKKIIAAVIIVLAVMFTPHGVYETARNRTTNTMTGS